MAMRLKRLVTTCLLAAGLMLGAYMGTRIHAFVHIFMKHAGVALTQDEVALAHSAAGQDARPTVVPRIMHQIFHNWDDPGNDTLPHDWEETRQTCILQNRDWEYELWTEDLSRAFIQAEYPWFLDTYDNFRYRIQKIDAVRYFIMRHYGGIYIDLDNGCLTSLEPLLYYKAWVTDGGHGALSNNILGAEPQHPYWILMTESIQRYAWNYPFPYITISYATGQWFETAIWEKYHAERPEGAPPLTRIMMDSRPSGARWVFFSHTRGGTWDNWDNRVFAWVGSHLFAVALCVLGAVAVLGALGFGVARCVRWTWRRRGGYRPLGR